MIKNILFAVIFSLFLTPIFAFASTDITSPDDDRKPFTTVVDGTIIDKETKEPISSVTVYVEGTTLGVISDEFGRYSLKLPKGEHTINFSFIGYKEFSAKVANSKNIDVFLEEDTFELDQIVVSSNRYATKKRESVNLVGVVSPLLFETTASKTPADALNFQTGTRVDYSCSNCGSSEVRINGLEGAYSQILIDSRPVMSALSSVYGLEILPNSMIERIETIRGGGSALYGSSAIGGVINIITKEPIGNKINIGNETSVFKGGGTDIYTSANGSFITPDSRTGVFLFGSVRDRDAYDHNGDGFSDMPTSQSESAGFRAFQKIGQLSKLTLEYHHLKEFRRGGDNMDSPAHESEIAEQLEHTIDGGGLKYDLAGANGKGNLSIFSSFQNTKRDSYFGTGQDLDAYGHTTDLTLSLGSQWDYSFDKLLFMPSILTLGAEYTRGDLNDEMLGYDRVTSQLSHVVGGYFQNEWKVDKFSALIGGRVDKHSLMDNVVFTPRFSLRYAPQDWITLRANISTGYRAPQIYDEDLHIGAVGGEVSLITVSEDLKPERSFSTSGSVDFYKDFGGVKFNMLVEGFYTELNDVFVLVENGTDASGNYLFERRNEEGATVKGMNLEVRFNFDSKVDLQAGYTFQKSRYMTPFEWSEDVEAQTKMFRSPDSYGYITATYNPVARLSLSATTNFTGKMLVQHCAGTIEQDTDELVRSFADLAFRGAYKLRLTNALDLEMSCGVKNILNQYQDDLDYGADKDAGYIYGPLLPRTVYFGVKFML